MNVNTEFTTRCKPLVTLKNRQTRLDVAGKHVKQLEQFWIKILWTNETKINFYQDKGNRRGWRRKETAHDPKPPHHLSDMVEAVL